MRSKNTITRKITHHVSVMLVLAMALLYVGAFIIVNRIVYADNRKLGRAMVSVFADLVLTDANADHVPLSVNESKRIKKYGDYICKWYDMDYAYFYIPDVKNNTVQYIGVSRNADQEKTNKYGSSNRVFHYKLSSEESAVWNGEKTFGYLTTNTRFGHEYSTVLRATDSYGNPVMVGVDTSIYKIQKRIIGFFAIIAVIIALIIVGIDIGIYFIIKRRVVRPAQTISKSMTDFITDGKHSTVLLPENDTNEFSMIADAYNSMARDIDDYLKDIQTLSREQERQNAELEIAAGIQRGFLPKERLVSDLFDLHTYMKPAKNIGGDLYDYLQLDEHRMLLVIADVSGKGISAAIYMAVLLMQIRQFAKMNLTTAEILEKTNDALSENNALMLFATVFIGIYNTETKHLSYANAGHNPPYIVGKTLRILDENCGTLLGLFPGEHYTESRIRLFVGDTLFCYTDGVNEAVNVNRKFYGIERLEDHLHSFITEHPADLITSVRESVEEFADNAEQHDDITMLTMSVKESRHLSLDFDRREMERIKEAILSLPLQREIQLNLCLIAEEYFINICSYAFEDGAPPEEKIDFEVAVSDRITMKFTDGGMPFDPVSCVEDFSVDDYDIDTQIGGLGTFIARSVLDDAQYVYKDGKNILILTKYFLEEES